MAGTSTTTVRRCGPIQSANRPKGMCGHWWFVVAPGSNHISGGIYAWKGAPEG